MTFVKEEIASSQGLDPDHPRHPTRSVVLT
jgi:hypothetical protein